MKTTIIRVVLIILLVLTFILIFNFSNQNGTTSGGVSRRVSKILIDIFPWTRNLNEETKNDLVEKSQFCVRKTAHVSIYTVVGILLMSLMNTYEVSNRYRFLVTIFIGASYAGLDEFHQWFIPGRSASVIDVGIDSCGVLLGSLLVFVTYILKIKRRGFKS